MSASDPKLRALSGGPLTTETAEEPEGDRYRETGSLGRGGMGRVDAVDDRWLGREVARKETLTNDPALEGRLRNEARVTARLEHPGIVPVYDLGRTDDGRLYYTMRLVRGRSLSDAIEEASTPTQRMALVRHVLDACHAVAYAHSHGVIHRDLKPENILVGAFGETQVADWGLAFELSELPLSEVAGTPGWMAPEQEQGRCDARSDVWALGRLLGAVGVESTELNAIVARATEADPTSAHADAHALGCAVRTARNSRPASSYRSRSCSTQPNVSRASSVSGSWG